MNESICSNISMNYSYSLTLEFKHKMENKQFFFYSSKEIRVSFFLYINNCYKIITYAE